MQPWALLNKENFSIIGKSQQYACYEGKRQGYQ
jgi:hypothetical protein